MAELSVRMSPSPICDFCSDEEPRYMEDCQDFTARMLDGEYVGVSTGEWAACEGCHQLVQARKWSVLERRCIDAMQRKYPTMPRSRIQHGVRLIQMQFRSHQPVHDLDA